MAIGKARDLGINSTQKPKSFNRLDNNADFSNTATGTYTDNGVNYKYVTFTGNGTLTITRAGFVDLLVIGGGGGGHTSVGGVYNGGGGGAGGFFEEFNQYLPAGNIPVVVGAGGNGFSSPTVGGYSKVGPYYAYGGGRGGNTSSGGATPGASGGGLSFAMADQGNNGGTGFFYAGGGGAGASPVGNQWNPGAGKASSIAGGTPTTAYTAGSFTFSTGGGGLTNGANRSANTGDGGNGGAGGSDANKGGSGIVIVRVAV